MPVPVGSGTLINYTPKPIPPNLSTPSLQKYLQNELLNISQAILLANQNLGNVISAVKVATLPTAATSAGRRFMVSDSTVVASANFGAIVAGGGTHIVPVFSDGTNWLIG